MKTQKRILVVDDDEPLVEALALTLRRAGYMVFTASSIEAALREFDLKALDIVLLDLKLGNRSGEELLGFLKIFELPNPKKIIVMTGNGGLFDMKHIDGLVSKVLEKPFSMEQLLKELEGN